MLIAVTAASGTGVLSTQLTLNTTSAVLAVDGSLGTWDWLVLCGYFAVLIAAGVWFARQGKGADSKTFFGGGGNAPVWVIAVSFLATAQSAATVLGAPEDAYRGDLRYLSTNIGGILAAFVLAGWFIPAYYRLGVTTPYQLLEHRFGPGAKIAASCMYMLGRVLASGARVFIGSVPVAMAIFGTGAGDVQPMHIGVAVVIFMVFGALFTLAGGLSSVIWTDVIQVAVYVGGALLVIVFLWRAIGADAQTVLDAVQHGGPDGSSKLRVLSLGWEGPGGFSFKEPYTLITACTGWLLLLLAAYGTDQDLVQRLLATENARKGSLSIIWGRAREHSDGADLRDDRRTSLGLLSAAGCDGAWCTGVSERRHGERVSEVHASRASAGHGRPCARGGDGGGTCRDQFIAELDGVDVRDGPVPSAATGA
jgi:hypothetical protein